MRLLSVNVSLPKQILADGTIIETGIFKEPRAGRVLVRKLNVDGDRQADLRVHGGIHKAVYAYTIEHYDHWRSSLGRNDLELGQFGENFTVERMDESDVHVGDVFRIGGTVVQVSQPRVPCFKLGIKMGSSRFLKPFLASGRVGFYLRVQQEGEVGPEDAIEVVHRDPAALSIREVTRLMYFEREDLDGARRAVEVDALAPGWRRSFLERLQEGKPV
jgi:MOSC domain-containing protein YiiM